MSEFFCLTKPKNFVEGRNSVLCFRKFPVAKKFTDKTGGGSVKIFRRNFFCLTVPKNVVEEPFRAVVSVNFW